MKTTKITYIVFVTTTLLTAILLFTAVHITDPVYLTYRQTVRSLCDQHAQISTEEELLIYYPELELAKAKIESLKHLRCQMHQLSAGHSQPYEVPPDATARCQERISQLTREILEILEKVRQRPGYASMLRHAPDS